ncbi:GNAT family N-acetyltransferase [Amycolatopsis rifamycinica]|uniref:GNAT family N-acetyltransferase n=1 Tax=Amycolatopsis rifamycinica TaxID=287986 RepID=UPI001F355BED|nr:GNAT family protein [Amycolatopsis rifamycinica]
MARPRLRARVEGYRRVWATVWDWNTASRRVLAKLGFTETGRTEVDPARGTTLFTARWLCGQAND